MRGLKESGRASAGLINNKALVVAELSGYGPRLQAYLLPRLRPPASGEICWRGFLLATCALMNVSRAGSSQTGAGCELLWLVSDAGCRFAEQT